MFRPLAYSKNLAMAIAAFLAITLDPAMRMMFARIDEFTFRPRWLAWIANRALVGYYSEEAHPISKALHNIYEPPAGSCSATRRRRSPRRSRSSSPRSRCTCRSAPSSCRRSARRSSTCPPRSSPACRSPRPEGAPGPGQAPHDLPRGGARVRQGRPRQHLHGPGPVHDDGDHHHPEARVRVAREAALVLVVGAGLGEVHPQADLARSHLARGSRERDEREAPAPRHLQRVDHADQGTPRHALDRHPHAGRHQDERRGPRDDRARGEGDRGHHQKVPGTRSVYAERARASSSTSS